LVKNANGTFSVPLISKRKFSEVMELRALLEGRATAEACGRIDELGFAELHACAAGLQAAIERNDIHDYLDFNRRLKFTIYRYSPSRTLLSHIELLWLQAGPFLRHLNTDLRQMTKANFHDEAIAELEKGNSAKAAAALSRDILAGMTFLLERAEFADDEAETAVDTAECDGQ
jgi:DNA-binding GntR family transcriptional regulator